jgi:hypothetical protein
MESLLDHPESCFLCGTTEISSDEDGIGIPVIPMHEVAFILKSIDVSQMINCDTDTEIANNNDTSTVRGCSTCRNLVFRALELKAEIREVFDQIKKISQKMNNMNKDDKMNEDMAFDAAENVSL